MRIFISYWFWCLAYVAMSALLIAGFSNFRSWAKDTYATEAAQVQWQAWKSDVRNQADAAPVQRREPKSDQPPAIVLLFQYYWICLGITLVLSTVLFVVFMILVRGVIQSPGPVAEERSTPKRTS